MSEVPDFSNPLSIATADELIGELKKRFPLGIVFLLRKAGPEANVEECLSPWWGNLFAVYGAIIRFREMIRLSMDRGLWQPATAPFPDDRWAEITKNEKREEERDSETQDEAQQYDSETSGDGSDMPPPYDRQEDDDDDDPPEFV